MVLYDTDWLSSAQKRRSVSFVAGRGWILCLAQKDK